jgi:hypothetical protein
MDFFRCGAILIRELSLYQPLALFLSIPRTLPKSPARQPEKKVLQLRASVVLPSGGPAMIPLSATEAISPAIEHTKALLRPFSLGLWLKLGLVAVFAEMGGQFISPPIGNMGQSSPSAPGIGAVAGGLTGLMVGIMVVAAIVGLIVGLALLYLGSRLQLVLMDLVATRTTIVGDAWRRTAPRTWRWIGVKIVCSLVAFAAVGAVVAVPIVLFIRSMAAVRSQHSGVGMVAGILPFVAAVLFAIFALVALIWFLRDFVLPFILFEDASFGDSLRRAWRVIGNEPGACFFYLFMKLVLSIVAGIAAELCIVVVAIVAAIPTGIVGYLLWSLLHASGPFGTVMMYISFALLGALFLAVFLAAGICLAGALLIFYQAYSLYFIGGRIPQVGLLLEPPPPYYPPPSAPAFSPI